MAAQIVFRTQGTATAFVSTIDAAFLFRTSSQSVRSFTTTSSSPLFLTGSRKVAMYVTVDNPALFITPTQKIAFLVTPDTGTTKLLVPKIGTLTFDTNQTSVEVPDATGEYNPAEPDENPGGYNPDTEPPVSGRPQRQEVFLWTVYRIWSRPFDDGYGSNTQTPSSQAEEADPDYVYTLTFPTEDVDGEAVPINGIYEIIMIAAPNTETYSDYLGDETLAKRAEEYPDWYVTGVGVMVDPELINCLNRKRYEFLQGVMCGKCDDDYFVFYSDYIGMLSAMEIQDWPTAVELYNKLKTQCSAITPSCGC